jgi:hypothetical protein
MKSEADIKVSNQPAPEGRNITPAGSLVLDFTTRQHTANYYPEGVPGETHWRTGHRTYRYD